MSSRALVATYRLQLNSGFPLAAARALVPYLADLGVSHVYASPVLRSRRGSTHGYDVVDPTEVNPELGTEAAFRSLARALQRRGMGLVIDIVPNHMGVGAENPFWQEMLAHGRSAPAAAWFDVDWDDPRARGRVVLPILGRPLGDVLAAGELRVVLDAGVFHVSYFSERFALDPATVPLLFADGSGTEDRRLARILEALRGLPARDAGDPTRVERAAGLLARLRRFGVQQPGAVATALRRVNADPMRLRRILDRQGFRLIFWRRAGREINYRRFFDVSELVALRQEDPAVFAATHARYAEWAPAGIIDGLRVDHVDGLYDPRAYLRQLRVLAAGCAIYVEKILTGAEQLPSTWPVQGTTGYEFLGELDAVFLAPDGAAAIEHWYRKKVAPRRVADFDALVLRAKRAVLDGALHADVARLARRLAPLAGRRPNVPALTRALREVLVFMPVYRSYLDALRPGGTPADQRVLSAALTAARRRGRASRAALAAVGRVLTRPHGAAHLDIVQRFQQTSSPAMAKGVEDTALYAYVPLVSRNEVGSGPERALADACEVFHDANRQRAINWPRTMLCTSTHDTKRSGDVRARLHVLSELPDQWQRYVASWRRWNRPYHARVGGVLAPDFNTEYLLYQTLVGVWPLPDPAAPHRVPSVVVRRALCGRVQAYMQKAAREAKLVTSWTDPDARVEAALAAFVTAVVTGPGRAFRRDLQALVATIARPGLWNALARTLVHLTAPGVPDLYQGDETWTFSLVDPDNRQPVDYRRRATSLARITDATADVRWLRRLVARPEDGRLKLFVTYAALGARRRLAAAFGEGEYLALAARGARRTNVLAFARQAGRQKAVVLVPRLPMLLPAVPVGEAAWGDTVVPLPRSWRVRQSTCAFTGRPVEVRAGVVSLSAALDVCPVGLLTVT